MRIFAQKQLFKNLASFTSITLLALSTSFAVAAPGGVSGDKPNKPGKSDNPHEIVSSDGWKPTPADIRRYAHMGGNNGFEGYAGEAGDISNAENSGTESTAEEVWDLLSLEAIGAESIIGVDSRVKVTNTTTFPARATALVTFTGGRCTGWMYGPDIVMTAGHCVHTGAGGTWRSNVVVYPGRNGASSPYGSCTARRLHTVSGWASSSNESYDYGAIKLNCTVGYSTGWYGYWWQTASLTGTPTTISGYPGDKPLEQWRSYDSVRVTGSHQLFYQNDTTGGMSGSPVYAYRSSGSSYCSGYCAMAIHAYGLHGSYPHSSNNHGTRIREAVFNNMQSWKYAP